MNLARRPPRTAAYLAAMTDVMFTGVGMAAVFLLVFVLARSMAVVAADNPVILTVSVQQGTDSAGAVVRPEDIGLGFIVILPSASLASDSDETTGHGLSLQTLGDRPSPESPAFRWASNEAIVEMLRQPTASTHLLLFVATAADPGALRSVDVDLRIGGGVKSVTLIRDEGFAKAVPLARAFTEGSAGLRAVAWTERGAALHAGGPPLAFGTTHTEDTVTESDDKETETFAFKRWQWHHATQRLTPTSVIRSNPYRVDDARRECPDGILVFAGAPYGPVPPVPPMAGYPSVYIAHSESPESDEGIEKFRYSKDVKSYRARISLSGAGLTAEAKPDDFWGLVSPIIKAMAIAFARDVLDGSLAGKQALNEVWALVTRYDAEYLVARRSDNAPELTTALRIGVRSGETAIIDVACDAPAIADTEICLFIQRSLGGLLESLSVRAVSDRRVAIGRQHFLVGVDGGAFDLIEHVGGSAISTRRIRVSPPARDAAGPDARAAEWLFSGAGDASLRPGRTKTVWRRDNSSLDLAALTPDELAPLVVLGEQTLASLGLRQDPALWIEPVANGTTTQARTNP